MMWRLAQILTFPEISERFTLNDLSIPTQQLQELTMLWEMTLNLANSVNKLNNLNTKLLVY